VLDFGRKPTRITYGGTIGECAKEFRKMAPLTGKAAPKPDFNWSQFGGIPLDFNRITEDYEEFFGRKGDYNPKNISGW